MNPAASTTAIDELPAKAIRITTSLAMSAAHEQAPTKPTRVLLVDDHPVVREGLAESINRESDLTVCAQAEDHQGALRAIETAHPELVVVDLMLGQSSGMELIKDIHARWPRLFILVVSMHDETLYAERVLRAGAQGYITKQQATHDILFAIRRVIGGGIYLNERTASAVLARLAAKPQLGSQSIPDLLADRELEVFELTGRGLSTRVKSQVNCVSMQKRWIPIARGFVRN